MGRRPTGGDALDRARKDLAHAKSVEQFRTAQAVMLPLDFGFSLEETARAVGRSPAWVAKERRRYIKGQIDFSTAQPRGWGGRRKSVLSEDEELEIVKQGVILSAYTWEGHRPKIRVLIEDATGRSIVDSTLDAIIRRVTKKIIPGGRPSDLRREAQTLRAQWLREGFRIPKRIVDIFQS